MKMSELSLAPASVAVTGIESGDYFAVDVLGFAMIHCCRAYVHGVIFDESQEPSPFRPKESFVVLSDNNNMIKLQHQCLVDKNKSMGLKPPEMLNDKAKANELVAKYAKRK